MHEYGDIRISLYDNRSGNPPPGRKTEKQLMYQNLSFSARVLESDTEIM